MFELFHKQKEKKLLHPTITIRVEKGEATQSFYKFNEAFQIGRDEACQMRFSDHEVSRNHAEVFLEHDSWWIQDLHSSNGTYVDGEKIDKAPLLNDSKIELGEDGPVLLVTVEEFSPSKDPELKKDRRVDHYIEHYFTNTSTHKAGEHTMFIRQAFEYVQQKQKWKYGKIIAVFAFLSLAAGTYAIFKHQQVQKHKQLALEIFYSMKALELDIAKLERKVKQVNNIQGLAEVRKSRARHREMQENYQHFVDELGLYSKNMSKEERLIFQIASIFGECELNMPKGFVREVKNYINKWQSTDRFAKAIRRAERNGYTNKIAEAMLNHDLSPQFFYLALQESDFDLNRCGPRTKYGIAKGMWQFIPQTGRKYGLRIGPLYRYSRSDPRDERHDFEKATKAASEYLRFIYSTEAQASGLLVMASYNWGEDKVRELINKMPENPRDRNFWRLLENYKAQIPQQTYDYVFYIVSAAVIGENPHFFGFQFDNPLSDVEEAINSH